MAPKILIKFYGAIVHSKPTTLHYRFFPKKKP